MNAPKQLLKRLSLLLIAVCTAVSAMAALSGTYTINPAGSATASNYLTLTSAISDLTSGTRADGGPSNGAGVSGAVILELASGYTSGGETFPLTFGAITGVGSTNTVTIRPAAAVGSALTITSANATATIDLNGANYVVFDGRPGGSGSNRYLVLDNSNTAGSAVRYINDASANTIQYCSITGVNTSTTSGVVLFSTAGSGNGNDNNFIANSDIKDGSSTPVNCIYSAGTAAKENSGNFIGSCKIANYFSAGTATNAILLSSNSTDWTIAGNFFYQTSSRVYTASAQHNVINIQAGNGHTIRDNTIGFATSSGTGTYTMTSTSAVTFRAINLAVGTTTATSVQGNVITAISLTSTSTASTGAGVLCGIAVTSGNVNIGTTSGNTIGFSGGTGAISLTPGSAGAIIGINAATTGTINIQNNTMGSWTCVSTTAANGAGLHGIYVSAAAASINISNNTIGNSTPNNMVAGSSGVTTGTTSVSGVFASSTSTALTANNNIIQNLTSYGSSTSSYIRGWQTTTSATTGSVLINSNTIRNLTTAGALAGQTSGQTVAAGIHFGGGLNAVLSNNTISNISCTNTGTANTVVTGIALASAQSTRVTKNKIYGLSNAGTGTTVSSPPIIAGVVVRSHTTSDTIDNNMISLGNGITTNTVIMGLYYNHGSSPNPVNIAYYNTINIEGTVSSGALSTFCINRGDFSSSRTMTMDVRNNILTNTRTGGTGKHYAISNNFNVAASATGWGTNASNYNILNANASTIGYWGADKDFANWKSSSASDANSYSGASITFNNSATGDLHINMGTTPNLIESNGVTISGYNTDIDGQTRPGPSGSVNGGANAPDIGADEFDGVILDITAPVISYSPLLNTTSTANRTTSSFATITDNYSGVNTTAGTRPRLYFKKSTDANAFAGNTSGNNGWKWVEANNTSSPFDFTINYSIINGGSVSVGDVIQYFVVAQDLTSTPNTGANPSTGFVGTTVSSITSAPTTPNSYVIVVPLSTNLNVGSGQTYTSLTNSGGLFEAINNGLLSGNTTAYVTSDLSESGTNALNAGGLNGYSLTIVPSAAALRTISNSTDLSVDMIRINGAANVTIDGRSGGSGQYFRIINTHATPASCMSAIAVQNSSSNLLVRNCILESNTSATGTVSMGTGTNSLTLSANDIRDAIGTPGTAGVPLAAIYSSNTSNSIVIGGNSAADGNNIYNFTNVGVGLVGIANGAVIKYNNVYQTASRSTATFPIYVNTGSNHIVSNNNVYQTSGTLTAQFGGIVVQGGGDGNTITNNSIGGSNASHSGNALTVNVGSTCYGIFCNSGTGTATTISGNTFSNFANIYTSTSGVVIGINATGNVDIKNNTLGGGANAYDTIMNAYDNGIITYSGTNTANIEGNNIGNVAYYRNSGDRTSGISISGAGTVNIIKNIIHDIKANSTGTTTTSFSSWGIWIGAAISGSSVIDSNTIYNIENTSTGTSAYPAAGIRITTAPNAGVTISRNRIYNIKTNGAGTGSSAPTAAGISLITSSNALNIYNNQITVGTGAGAEAIAYGIYDGGTGGSNFYYNSVAITGTMSGANSSYAYFRNTTPTPSIKNNIFYNDRSGSTGGQFAIGTASTTNWSSTVANNNLFVVSNLSNMGEWATGTSRTLAQWQASSGGDANSTVQTTATLPIGTFFTAPASGDLSVQSGSLSYIAGMATPVTVTTDYTGATRSAATPTTGTIEVPVPTITTNPSNVTVCSGTATSFTVVASGSLISGYIWQVDNGGGYTNISNGGVYSNATTATLNISSTVGMNGYNFRALATNPSGNSAPSTAATLTLNFPPTITTDPVNATPCAASPASFTVAASGLPTSYVWQVDNGGGYTNISNGGVYSNATTATLNISSSTGLNGYNYRALAVNGCGTSTPSAAATLIIVSTPGITTDPSNSTVCTGTATSFTVAASNLPTSYVWQVNNGGGYTNISNGGVYSNATTATLNISSTTGFNGYTYRAIAVNGCGLSTPSAAATLSLNFPPSVTTNPSNSTVCTGAATSFTVAASNTPTSYVWQVDNGGGYANISNGGVYSNATTSTLNISSTTGLNGYLYRAIAVNGCGSSSPSTAATLSLNFPPSITTNPSAVVVCQGAATSFTVAASNTPTSYVWQVDNGGGYANISNGGIYSNATTATLNISSTTGLSGYLYRAIAVNGCGSSSPSAGASITYTAQPAVSVNPPATTTVCAGSNTTITVTATGAGIAYQWQVSNNGGSTWSNLANTAPYSNVTTATMSITSATSGLNNNQYRCYVSGTCSPAVNSTASTLTVNDLPAITTNPAATATVCENQNTSFTVVATGAGIGYQWQVSTNGGSTWANLTNAAPYSNVTTATLNITSAALALNNNQYRAVVTGTCLPAVNSSAGTLQINASPVVTANPSNASTCPASIASFTVAATGAGLSYQWQLSINSGSTWSNLTNTAPYSNVTAATMNITGATLSMDGYQYRCVVSGTCSPSATSNAVTLTLNNIITITSQPPVSQAVCTGSNITIPVTQTGATTFQWYGDFGSGFVALSNNATYSGVTTSTLSITNATSAVAGTYRCIVGSACTSPFATNTSVLNVYDPVTIVTQPSSVNSCEGTTTLFSVAATGGGMLTYQWQLSTNSGSTWSNLSNSAPYSGATTNQLAISNTPFSLNSNQYRCVVTSGCLVPVNSSVATLTVTQSIVINTQPAATQFVCTGSPASISVVASNATTYQWQIDQGSGYVNLTNTAPYSGVTTATLSISSASLATNGTYRCILNNGICNAVSTNGSILNIYAPINITAQPVSTNSCAGSNSYFSVAATGGGTINYQWQVSTNSGSTWSNLSNTAPYTGATSNQLTITNTSFSLNSNQYRCVVTSGCLVSVNSSAATLTVTQAIVINTQPAATQTVCSGVSASISVVASNATTYQWQFDNGSGFVNLTNTAPYSGVATASLSINPTSVSNAGTYRCILGNGICANVTSNASALSIFAPVSISSQPVSANNCVGNNSYFSVTATGGGALSYQWQVSTNGGSTWSNLSNTAPYTGATSNQLTITNTTFTLNNNQYRCIVTSSCLVPVSSNSATLTVTQAIVITTQPVASQTICAGTGATISVVASNATTYQWQRDNGSGYVNLTNTAPYSGVTTSSLSVSPTSLATNGTYRCVTGNGICSNVNTNGSILNVYPVTTVTVQPLSVTTCQGVSSYFSVTATGGGTLTYQWQVSTNGGSTWSNLSNTAPYSAVTSNQLTITNTPIGLNTYQYRCIVIGACGSTATSSAAILTINTPPTVNNPVAVTTCLGTNASYTVTGGGTSISYRWQESTNGGTAWSNLNNGGVYSNVTAATLNLTGVTASMNGRWYRCIVTGICPTSPAISNGAMLTVTMPPSVTTHPTAQTICLGNSTSYSISATGTGPLSYQWQEDQGGGYTNLSNGSSYNGVTTPTLNVNFPALTANGYNYRCYVSGACSPATVSNGALLTVNDTATLVSIGYTDTLCSGDSSIFSVTIGGPVTSIRWQVNQGSGFTDIPLFTPPYIGANTPILKIVPTHNSQYGYQYRCVVSSGCNTLISNVFGTIVYKVPEVTGDPIDAKVPQGQDATFQATASDTGYLYYWQGSSDGGNNWSNIYNNNMYSGTLTPMLTVLKVNPAQEGWMFRCIILDPKGYCYVDHDTSNAAKLSVALMPPFPVNVSNVKEQVRLTVYPNPVQGSELMVRVEGTERKTMNYRIIDEFGRTVQRSAVELDRTHTGRMEVNTLVPAVYTIQFTDEQNNVLQSVRFTRVQ